MSLPGDYIKGYKLDRDKLRSRLGSDPDDPLSMRFHDIVRIFPRGPYKYIGSGRQLDGTFCLVIVLVDGNDKAKVESTPMPDFRRQRFRTVFDCRGMAGGTA
jgi:hypothetical protein